MGISFSEKQELLNLMRAVEPQGFAALHDIWEFLRVSEQMLLDALHGRPRNPALAGKGEPEVGHFLHYLNHPHPHVLALVAADEVAQEAWKLVTHPLLPASAIAPGFFDKLQANAPSWPIVGSDGQIYGFDKYEALDVGWLATLVNQLITLVRKPHAFGTKPYEGALSPGRNGKVRIGILGDWGTGSYGQNAGPAIAVKDELTAQQCDYLVHLGDVYYSGTPGAPYVPPSEEQVGNFLNWWPQMAGSGRCFALNSNHDMYSGGFGYFPVTLGSNSFAHQEGTSYFALSFGNWAILGLDSAYHAPPNSLYLKGVLGPEQAAWIKDYAQRTGLANKKILVLSHHEALDAKGQNLTPLYDEVVQALGRTPDVWYWGHLHNGIAYSKAAATSTTKARCVGHSAIPFGLATDLFGPQDSLLPTVAYFARTPADGKRMRNGYATLELSLGGSITEKFFEQGNASPVWQA